MLDTAPDSKYRREVYTVFELAMALGCNKGTIYALHNAGKLTIVKLGRKSVIFRDEVDRYRRENAMPRAAAPAKVEGA
jgi:excisionase family DNA binding protein